MPILDQCSHQFVWPRRSADGRYYQVCRICQAEYEYDWESMQRVQHREDAGIPDGEIQVADPEVPDTEVTDTEVLQHDAGPGPHVPVRREPAVTQQAAVPRLLLDQESAYRVFLGNLTDFIWRRTPRAIPTTSTPATFWNDVFLPSSVPWRRFAESLLGHVILVTLILILVPRWPAGPAEKRSAFDKSYVSYYTPPKSFPALHSHAAKVQPKVNQTHVNRQPIPEHRPAIKVAPEHASGQQERNGQGQGITLPADLVSSRSGGLSLSGSHSPVPMMPLAATGGSQRRVPAAETWLVAPPADASLPTARGAGALQASAVAPAPEVAGVSSRRGNATVTAHAAVVAPAPSVSGAMRRLSDINIGESAVVKPAPQLPMSEQGTFSAMARGTLGGVGAAIVPPLPSVQSAGTLPAGRASLLAGSGSQVVPPAPSLGGASDVAGSARGRGLSGSGPQVVGPAPSVQGAGSGAGGGRMGSLSGGVEAVAPAPSIAGNGYGNGNGSGIGNGRGNSLSGAGLEGMPPSGKGTGTGAGDLTGSGDSSTGSPSGSESGSGSSGTGSGTGPGGSGPGGSASGTSSGQAGSGQGGTGTGTGTGSGNGSGTGSGLGPGESSSAAGRPHEPDTIEIPLRLIGPVLALPGSSYFSNYEVFIAERKRSKGELELIKLVYVSLPYQKRLAEYGPDNWTVPRLRVTRDQSCDESLMQMTWPETDPRPTSQPSADSPALSARDRSGMLPCYRTTADDYRRALSRNH